MNSKLPAFILGAAAGAGLTYLAVSTQSGKAAAAAQERAAADSAARVAESGLKVAAVQQQLAQEKARTGKLESDNLQLAKRVQDLMQQAPPAPTPDKSKGPSNPLAAMFGGDSNDTNGPGNAMQQMMKAALEQQMEGKITRMKSKLNLSPDQEKGIREALSGEMKRGQENALRMLKGDTKSEEPAKAPVTVSSDEAIKALLTPEQQTGYEQLKQEEVSNNARLLANSELLQMQNTLGLDAAQQDKVFAVLYEQSRTQLAAAQTPNPGSAANPLGAMTDMMQKKLDALKGVLTDDQFESYRKFQDQQMKLIQSLMPKEDKAAGVTAPQIQVVPKP
jgi:hypothetical protein